MHRIVTEAGREVLVRVESLEAARVRHVPHAQRLVVGRREQVAPARVPRGAAHPVVVPHQRRQALARAHVPDLTQHTTPLQPLLLLVSLVLTNQCGERAPQRDSVRALHVPLRVY